MKKIISIALVLVIMLNSILFGVIYFVLKGELKKDFLSVLNIKDSGLQITSVTSEDIKMNPKIVLLEYGELKIDGEYFDIFKTEQINGKTIYYCISDKNEEHLEIAFNNFLSSSSKNFASKTTLNLLKLISISGFPVSFNDNSIIPHFKTDSVMTIYGLQDAIVKIPTPPPELLFS
jgi:hypothetical protein